MKRLGCGLALVIALTLTGCDGGNKAEAGNSGDPSPSSSTSASLTPSPSESPEPYKAPRYHPTKGDFHVRVQVTSKQCFGTAGCLVDYKVSLSYGGPAAAGKLDHAYDLTYRVTGDESGPILDTITVQPNLRYAVPTENSISTAGPSVKPAGSIVRLQRSY